ncbi:hypothetical protein AMECASPLE_024582 [Ameca splendens]|uniref:Uncharacterized protein n=1 Tax=Ameca splendens TaxID=208324 RepID=A0ABV0Z2F4_9TELE
MKMTFHHQLQNSKPPELSVSTTPPVTPPQKCIAVYLMQVVKNESLWKEPRKIKRQNMELMNKLKEELKAEIYRKKYERKTRHPVCTEAFLPQRRQKFVLNVK